MGHGASRGKPGAVKPEPVTGSVAPSPMTIKSERRSSTAEHKLRRDDSQQGLTEEMIEELTRSSMGSVYSKNKKKSSLDGWIAGANYIVKPEQDALKLHAESMRTLAALQTAKRRPRPVSSQADRRSGSQGRRK